MPILTTGTPPRDPTPSDTDLSRVRLLEISAGLAMRRCFSAEHEMEGIMSGTSHTDLAIPKNPGVSGHGIAMALFTLLASSAAETST